MSSELTEYLFKCYLVYAFGTMTLVLVAVALFYVITGNYRHAFLPNGHCKRASYIFDIHSTITRFAQIVLFGTDFFCYCKVNQHFCDSGVSNNDQKKKFSLIASNYWCVTVCLVVWHRRHDICKKFENNGSGFDIHTNMCHYAYFHIHWKDA